MKVDFGRRAFVRLVTLGGIGAAVAPFVSRTAGVAPRAATIVRSGWHTFKIDGMVLHLPQGATIVNKGPYTTDGAKAIEYTIKYGKMDVWAARWADSTITGGATSIQKSINATFGHLP